MKTSARHRSLRWLLVSCGWLAAASCASVREARSPLPVQNTLVREQLVIHSDSQVPAQHRLFEELTAMRSDVLGRLSLSPSDEPIHVYLFDSSERYHAFLRAQYPQFPPRRAFFVKGDTRLSVYAHWGDRVAEDLRHETAHGYLHSVAPNIPLWLDEGLAEFFETPRAAQGLNPPHVNLLAPLLAGGGWRPDIQRLEALDSAAAMTQLDYAESWAWAHWLLQTTPERRELLCGYFRVLRQEAAPPPLSAAIAQVEPDAPRELAEHIFTLATPR